MGSKGRGEMVGVIAHGLEMKSFLLALHLLFICL